MPGRIRSKTKSTSHQRGSKRSKEEKEGSKRASGIEKEKVAMCVINERGKRLSTMKSVEQVAEGVENGANFVIKTVENDETTTVEMDLRFEIPLGGVGFLEDPTYMV